MRTYWNFSPMCFKRLSKVHQSFYLPNASYLSLDEIRLLLYFFGKALFNC